MTSIYAASQAALRGAAIQEKPAMPHAVRSLTRPTAVLLGAVLALLLSASALAQTTSPSTTVPPYVLPSVPGVLIESILTVDDGTVPKTGGGTTRLAGIPDGIGVIDGAELSPPEPDFFYLIVNHELNSTQGIPRDHGNAGAFVSKWKVDKVTHEVVEGDDLIKETFDWDETTQTFVPGSLTFDRFCSSDRPAPTALYNSATGLGTQNILYFNGEESFSTGRAMGHVVTGPDAGRSYHLEHLGFMAIENLVLSPFEQDTTVAVLLDDATNGEVYVYVGTKQTTGNDVEKAGLVGGNLYAIAVVGKPFELDLDLASAVGTVEPFTLKLIGTDGNRPVDGNDTTNRGTDTITPVDPAQTFESLKMGGPEDGAWDTRPGFENTFYFVTKGTSSGGLNAPTRLWRLEFDDLSNPALGGTMTLLLDGPENRLGSLDNMGFGIEGGLPKLYIQEDLGGDARLSKIWEYDITTGQLEEIAEHDGEVFFDGGSAFLTTNEESSGVISMADILGEGWYASSIQVHTSNGLSDSAELVENGQLVLINLAGRGSDLLRTPLIANGDLWDYRVDGVDPGASWNEVGFVPDASWNVATDGTPTGPVPTMLGYGESAGRLATDLVQPPSPRAAAYYFRREFDLADPTNIALFDLYLKVDDGAVVYVNGVEVARYNLNLDLVVDNDTFASQNESAETDWKQIPITGADVPLQATGNVLAISVHQENDGSSDLRLDAELIAWVGSPDAGTAPATPTGLATANATEISLDLTWDGQSDAKFFRIERQSPGDAAWEVVEREYPGTFTSYVDTEVQSGLTYSYRIWAVNIHGRSALSATAEGTTLVSLLPVIFEENFEVPDSFGQFTPVDVAGPDRNFAWVLWDFGSTGAIQGNGFGGETPTEDWLITTNPINFLFFSEESLTYDAQIAFSGPAPEVLWSTDYDPLSNADPNEATWNVINIDTSQDGTLTPQGPFDISGIDGTAYIAYRYQSLGGGGGQSVRFNVDDVIIKGQCGFDFEGGENSDIADDPSTPWEIVNLSSEFGWIYDNRAGQQGAINNNFGSPPGGIEGGTPAKDWLISPPIFVGNPNTGVDFQYYENFGDTIDKPLSVLVTNSYTGDPTTTSWVDITPTGLDGSTSDAWIDVSSDIIGLTGEDVRVAFLYESAGDSGGTTKRIGVDQVCIAERGGPLEAGFAFTRSGGSVTFIPTVTGGVPPYDLAWDFGDGNTSDAEGPTNEYAAAGVYTVALTVTDSEGSVIDAIQVDAVEVTEYVDPEKLGNLRVASFNTSMNRPNSGDLATALASGADGQIQQVAEVIQRVDADIVLINEYDQLYDENGEFGLAATLATIEDFKANYLEVAQADDTDPVYYDYAFVSPSNTGVPAGLDLDNNGSVGGPGDAFGFGNHAGQFAMIVLSKHEILEHRVRTFQKFRWVDMPGAFLPPDPNDTDGDGDLTSYFTDEELEIYRLSSKTHMDVPVWIPGHGVLHVLASHPTPPVFDDGTATVYPDPNVADVNGLRNHDEIRFWADYVDPDKSAYIYDDREWDKKGRAPKLRKRRGGLMKGARFVIMGDQNADPVDGDATFNPALLLLDSPFVDSTITPTSEGALEQVPSGSERETKTASFNLRADYVLPSQAALTPQQGFVYWPLTTDLTADLLDASDHRMVTMDLQVKGLRLCGLGAELAFIVPVLIAARRRLRRRA